MPATPAHSCPHLLALPPTSPSLSPQSPTFSGKLGPGSDCLCQASEGASADVPSCCCHSGRDVWLGIGRRRTKQVWLPGKATRTETPFLHRAQAVSFPRASLRLSTAPGPADPTQTQRDASLAVLWSSASLPCGSGPGGTEPPRSNGTCSKEFENLILRERHLSVVYVLVG